MKRTHIALRFKAGVPAIARQEVRRVREWLTGQPIRHVVSVLVVPQAAVAGMGRADKTGFGVTVFHRGRGPAMCLAAGVLDVVKENGGDWPDRRHGLRVLAETFLHEWAHYEQYRDGRMVQERGVAVRARHLVKAYWRQRASSPAPREGETSR